MKNNLEILYCAEWAKDRERSWSGTTYGLGQALSAHFQLRDFDLPNCSESLFFRLNNRVRNYLGIRDFELSKMRMQQSECNKHSSDFKKAAIFQFSEVPAVENGETHYIYQDLPVEWLWNCRNDNPELFKYTGSYYQNISTSAFKARLRLQRQFYNDCRGVFTMGNWLAKYLVQECGLPNEKIHHVGGGINSSPHALDPLSRKRNTFLFAGRDFERKGGDLVLAAFAKLIEAGYDYRLIIAGPDENPAPGARGVQFVGDIDNSSLGNLMATSDVFVMPSRFEAYGLVFPEAMAAGLPCIGADKFEMPYFIEDGVNGRTVGSESIEELSLAMQDCLLSDSIREQAIKRSSEVQKEYSWNSVAQRIELVINEDMHSDTTN